MAQRILTIDDSPEIHAIVDARFKHEGVEMLHASDGEDGMRQARERRPDLILLDVDMPGLSGFEVCRLLKSDPDTSSVPIIFLTGANQVDAKVRGFELGGIDYVTKPFESAELRARVRAALRTKRLQDMLAARAQIDALTGLSNRAHFNQRIEEDVRAAHRYARPVSLVLIDVDHFKNLNDTYGHPFGDRVLQRLGEELLACSRTTDLACRYGGEEFALILSETTRAGALVAAERARLKISALELSERGTIVRITASLGTATSDDLPGGEGLTVATLLKAADDGLYKAKRGGRNQVCTVGSDAPESLPTGTAAA
jgi:diguanylate cyclase (GGDEF)-like protein